MGKSASKLKKKKDPHLAAFSRFGSIATLKSKLHPPPPLPPLPIIEVVDVVPKETAEDMCKTPPGKHLDIKEWLRILDLEQYERNFEKFGGVEELLDHTEADIKKLGLKISSHRAKVMSSLTGLRMKYYGTNKKRELKSRHSVAVESTKTIRQKEATFDLLSAAEGIQSKSLNNLIMEPCVDPSMDAATLKKTLEWELSLDSRDLRSHAWYHGAIPRARAEEIVKEEGEFLVRDCTSQPGNYVVTCRTKQQALHFVIKKIVLQPDTVYERVQFQFEGDAFDTVPDLITFYVGSGKPITAVSRAKIQHPKNRMYPLSFYATKYPSPMCQSRLTSPATTPGASTPFRHSPLAPFKSSNCSPTRLSISNPPRLPSKKQRSHSLTPSEVNRISQEKCNSADGVIQSPLMTRSAGCEATARFSTHSLPRNPCAKLSLSPSSHTLGRNGLKGSQRDSTLSPCAERRLLGVDIDGDGEMPPPKPSRIPSIMRGDSKEYDDCKQDNGGFVPPVNQRVSSYHASGSDSGNGSGDSALSSAAGDSLESSHRNSGVIIKNPRYNLVSSESSTTLKNFDLNYYSEAEAKLMQLPSFEVDTTSRFDIENFHTLLLPVNENKPLDCQALRGIKLILEESGSRILANHLTRVDFDLVFGEKKARDKFGFGIELCTLPHGHQFRLDLMERTECLKLLVAVTILTCQDESERTDILNKWIEVAIDTKMALGNLFGFCGIMLGLCLPQIESLNTTWHMLRQKYTNSAFNFEAKLRPTLKSMNSCSNPQAPNTTIPHLVPLILLLERSLDDFLTSNEHNSLSDTCLGPWELNKQDFGLSTLLAHLENSRKSLSLTESYQRNADIVLGEARMEELTLEMFKTEFMLKFLWGSRGALAPSYERHAKFEQILNVMAEKYCSVRVESEV